MDINLIKLVLLVVSPTITIIAINIHHHLAFGHDVAFFGGFNNLSPESFRNDIHLEFNISNWKTALWVVLRHF